ncbi:helix-turn-helix domain-containing protein [Burkholderia pseudomallei]|uniref:helix-turn-helix domain-containing protein n=1 Tax=Burkholderia pseudomallei TaxID=28450 RepID=UPI00237B3083|nr:helix-turn-helix domain-containing protein [Burkholderia pseudomallei]
MTISQVAAMLHIAPQTVRNRISLGHSMPPSFRIGRRRLFLTDQVTQWLNEQSMPSPIPRHGRPRRA